MRYTELNYIPKYVQAKTITKEMRRILFPYGSRYLFLLGCKPIEPQVREMIDYSFSHSMEEAIQDRSPLAIGGVLPVAKIYDSLNKPFEYRYEDVEGVAPTPENVQKVYERIKDFNADVIIAIGGGKTQDLAKEIQQITRATIVLMPTNCAANVSGIRLSIIYNEEGSRVTKVGIMSRMQEAVIVDPTLVIQAPAATFAAGISDAMAAYYEGYYSSKAVGVYDKSSTIGWTILEKGIDLFYEYGEKAYEDAKNDVISNEYELILEHTAFGNGVGSSMVGCISVGHALDEVVEIFAPARKILHGLRVGGTTVATMLRFGESDEVIHKYIDLMTKLNVPMTLEEFGIADVSDEELLEAAKVAAVSPTTNYAYLKSTPEELVKYLKDMDAYVKAYRGK